MKLDIGKQIEIKADPAERYQDTGIDVSSGELYQFQASGKWRDASHVCGPEGWHDWWTGMARKFSRLPENDFYYLGGNINRLETTNFPIGSSAVKNIEFDGTLYLFANDLWYFYFNNHTMQADQGGPLTVTIRRVS